MLFLFSFGGYKLGEYLYILLVSGLFAYACVGFAEKTGFNKEVFYALMLSSFVVNFAFIAGTELLTLTLLMFVVTYLQERKSAIVVGLSILSRYAAIPYLALLLFRKRFREVLIGLALVFVLFIPWFCYNWVVRDHPFYSMVASYFLNMVYKSGSFAGPTLDNVAPSLLVYLPLVVLGIYLTWRRGIGELDKVVFAFTALTLLSYSTMPVKELRYLYNLALPIGYFSCTGIQNLIGNPSKAKVLLSVALFTALNYTATASYVSLTMPVGFYESLGMVDDGCMVMSNVWPQLNYVGVPAQPYPERGDAQKRIAEGGRIILYRSEDFPKPDYMYDRDFILTTPLIEENEYFILLGNRSLCAPQTNVDKSSIDYYNEQGHTVRLCPLIPFICGW
ncbi:MAG: hypothetical protein V1744_03390 [Candidatus Altiarchaeota archaeon]